MQSSPSVASPASLALGVEHGLNYVYPEAVEDFRAHALKRFPDEACGVIMEDGGFMAVRNVSDSPTTHFVLDPDEPALLTPFKAVLHSHTAQTVTDGERARVIPPQEFPSALDMQNQIATAVPWGVSCVDGETATLPFWWGDQLPRLPLVGRTFRHGVTDCFELVRDWHMERGIFLKPMPREDNWWLKGGNLYEDYFVEWGFERVQRVAPIAGDCFIGRVGIGVSTYNHGGIYVGNGLILHHTVNRLSKHDPAHVWRNKMEMLLRHRDLPEE